MPDSKSAEGDNRLPPQVEFHYIKSNSFRVVHCDGAVGGISPSGVQIHMSLYSERIPIPLQVKHELDESGVLGPEISRVTRSGIVREVECDVVMSLEVARQLNKWIIERLDKADKLERDSIPPA